MISLQEAKNLKVGDYVMFNAEKCVVEQKFPRYDKEAPLRRQPNVLKKRYYKYLTAKMVITQMGNQYFFQILFILVHLCLGKTSKEC